MVDSNADLYDPGAYSFHTVPPTVGLYSLLQSRFHPENRKSSSGGPFPSRNFSGGGMGENRELEIELGEHTRELTLNFQVPLCSMNWFDH